MEHFFALMIGMLVLGFIGGFVWILRNKTDLFLTLVASASF